MTGGQAVPAANGPITQKQPVTLMQVSLRVISPREILIKYNNFYIFLPAA